MLVSPGLLDKVVSCEHLYSTPPKWCANMDVSQCLNLRSSGLLSSAAHGMLVRLMCG